VQALASAADLEARDVGGGRVRLRWTHASDPAQGVVFDVYSTPDPLTPARRLLLDAHASREAEVTGIVGGEPVYFTVVARVGALMALPSALAVVRLPAVPAPVALTPAAGTDAPAGLGFPFGIDAAGRVKADRGDALLRGRIVQLLLTSPGERVTQPEFGTRLRDLVFDPGNDVLAAATEFAVLRALRRYLAGQAHVDAVQVSSDDSELNVDITYLRTADLQTERLRIGIPIPR
jgi:uncharacterized protein